MNRLKKICSVVLSLCLIGALLVPAFAAVDVSRPKNAHIAFNADGKLKILQIADIQDDEILSPLASASIKAALDAEKPDLVVLTGDNIGGYSCDTTLEGMAAIRAFMSIFESYGVPVAMVFGNHDDQDTPMNKITQIEYYETFDCFVGCEGVVTKKTVGDNTMLNAGTYNIPIFASANSDEILYNIWCFDSGNYNPDDNVGGYGYVLPEQVDWYKETAEALKAGNGGEAVPSIAFQHIVPPQIVDALKEVPAGTPGAVSLGGKNLVLPDDVDPETNWLTEAPCPPNTSFRPAYAQVEAMLEEGDVQAVFFGHDHINSFVVGYQGIDLISSPGITYSSYNDSHRGFRVITLDKNDLSKYETYTILASDLLESSPVYSVMLRVYEFIMKIWDKIEVYWDQLKAVFNK